jgi:hypothetical protein
LPLSLFPPFPPLNIRDRRRLEDGFSLSLDSAAACWCCTEAIRVRCMKAAPVLVGSVDGPPPPDGEGALSHHAGGTVGAAIDGTAAAVREGPACGRLTPLLRDKGLERVSGLWSSELFLRPRAADLQASATAVRAEVESTRALWSGA